MSRSRCIVSGVEAREAAQTRIRRRGNVADRVVEAFGGRGMLADLRRGLAEPVGAEHEHTRRCASMQPPSSSRWNWRSPVIEAAAGVGPILDAVAGTIGEDRRVDVMRDGKLLCGNNYVDGAVAGLGFRDALLRAGRNDLVAEIERYGVWAAIGLVVSDKTLATVVNDAAETADEREFLYCGADVLLWLHDMESMANWIAASKTIRESGQRGNSEIRSAATAARPWLLPALVKRQNGKCGICGKQLPEDLTEVHIDHVFPVTKGGDNNIGNLQAAHRSCNVAKGARVGAVESRGPQDGRE